MCIVQQKKNVKLSVGTYQFFIRKLFKLLHVSAFRTGHHQVTSTSLDQEVTQSKHFIVGKISPSQGVIK
jgi:hypothetical protein